MAKPYKNKYDLKEIISQILDETFGFINIGTEGQKPTYSAATYGLAAVNGDVFTLSGSASKKIKITRINISGSATANAIMDVLVIKRSTLDTGGTATTLTRVPYDSSDVASTAVAKAYTVAPTPGTAVGNLLTRAFDVPNATTPGISSINEKFEFNLRNEKCLTLNNANEMIAINIPAVPSGGTFDIDITWTEE